MSETDDIKRDDAMIAAEYALGLLEGEELLMARGRVAREPEFAAAVAQWEERLAPLLDDLPGLLPSESVWQQIEARIAAQASSPEAGSGTASAGAEVIELNARVRRWQWVSALTSAAAVAALAVVALPIGPGSAPTPNATETPVLAAADPLVASIPIGDTALRLDVTYIPETERMLVTAIGLTPDGVHDHELWLVPADGSALQSLGVVAPGEVRAFVLPEDITRNMGDGVELVLTREPLGGKPEGVDAGPVVAQGAFTEV